MWCDVMWECVCVFVRMCTHACMLVRMWVHICIWLCMNMCACMWKFAFRYLPWLASNLFIMVASFAEPRAHQLCPVKIASLLWVHCLCLLHAGIADSCVTHTQLLQGFWDSELQPSHLLGGHCIHPLSSLPSSPLSFWYIHNAAQCCWINKATWRATLRSWFIG